MVHRITSLFIATLAAVILVSCSSTTYVSVPVMHPAEIGLSQYKRIYVGDFKNITLAPNLQDRIPYKLVNALASTGRFAIIDKDVFGRFSGSDMGTLTNMLVISGTITNFKPDQDVHRGEPYKTAVSDSKSDKGDKAGKRDSVIHVDFTRKVRVFYSVQFKIVGASDGRILGTPEVSREFVDSRTRTDEEPPRFEMDEIIRQVETELVGEFVGKIVPRREVLQIDFLTDDDMPELKQGIGAASNGDWKRSIQTFTDITVKYAGAKAEVRAKAYCDLGLALEFDHQYPEARAAFGTASALDPHKDFYRGEINLCNARESEWKRLVDQKWE